MKPSPSHLQRIASAPHNSVWVDASAGTGKTKVLTDRVLRFLLQGSPPSKILCLTFTKAAAAEMQTRIYESLSTWATCPRTDLLSSLDNLLGHAPSPLETKQARTLFFQLMDDAYGLKILTIHSFCQQMLARFPLEAGVPLRGDMLDEGQEQALLTKAMGLMIRDLETTQSHLKAFQHLNATYKPSSIVSTLMDIVREPKSRRHLSSLSIDQLTRNLEGAFGFPVTKSAQDCLAPLILDRPRMGTILHALKQGTVTDLKIADQLTPFLKDELTLENFDAYCVIFFTQAGEPRQRFGTQKAHKICPDILGFFHDQIDHLQKVRDDLAAWKSCVGTHSFITLAGALLTHYQTLKSQQGKLDFQDLITKSSQLLEQDQGVSWVLYKLDGGLDHILVDEAQDTSPDQWQIILKLAEDFFAGETARTANRTLFVVGDRKQSIYSFQGAEPHLFDHLRVYFQDKIHQAAQSFEHISLGVSFRSCRAILSVVDHVFTRLHTTPLPGHESFREQDGGSVTLWPLIPSPDKESQHGPQNPYMPSPSQQLATKIAHDIRQRLDTRHRLAAKGRPVQPDDFLILLQRRGSFMYQMIRALKRLNIPVAGPDRFDLMSHLAVQDLMALGQFLLLPEDDFSLACLLRSPLFHLSDGQLYEIAKDRGHKSLWSSLKAHGDFEETVVALKSLLRKVDHLTPYELYQHVLLGLRGRQKFRARLSDECEDALDEFLALAFDHSQENAGGLQGFLDMCHSSHPQVKRDFSGVDLGAVRIMTVHGAKGLQAPIVYLPDTTRIPKTTQVLLWQEDSTHGVYPLWRIAQKDSSEDMLAARDQASADQFAEYYRLLYVAMTRAEDELIIAGWETAHETSDACWYYTIEPSLHRLGEEDESGVYVHHCPHLAPLKAPSPPKSVDLPEHTSHQPEAIPSPDWLFTNPPAEIGKPEPRSPSGVGQDNSGDAEAYYAKNTPAPVDKEQPLSAPLAHARFAEGDYIHRLLEHLPTHSPQHWLTIAHNIALDLGLTSQQRDDGFSMLKRFLEDTQNADLFSKTTLAEVPIYGTVGDTVYKGKIDRLVFGPHQTVTIIDFKSNRQIPQSLDDIPPAYLTQLRIYGALLQKAYPAHTLHYELVFVRSPKRIPIPPSFLDAFCP